MRTKLTLVSVIAFVAGISAVGAQQQPPTENKGIKVEPLSGFPLGQQGLNDLNQRGFRLRQLTIEAGGVAGFHSHKDRPALTYIMKGTFTEHRKGAPDRIYKPGEVIIQKHRPALTARPKTT